MHIYFDANTMSSSTALFLSLIVIFAIVIFIRLKLKMRSQNHLDRIMTHMDQFTSASNRKDQSEILRIGNELVWNVHLTAEQLDILELKVNKSGIDNSEFAALKSNILKKRLQFERSYFPKF